MVKYLFFLLSGFCFTSAFSQAHNSKLSSCKFYVDPPRKPGEVRTVAIDGPVCAACLKEKQDKYDAERAEAKRKAEAMQARLEKEKLEREAKVKAVEEKNRVDLENLNALKASVAAKEVINDKYRQLRYAAEQKRRETEDRANSEYNAVLDKIQAAERQPASFTEDEFWNETVVPANYLPVENKVGLWGFTNKQGRQVLDYQYRWASAFSKGVSLVRLNNKENNYALINTRGEMIRNFNDAFFKAAVAGGAKIRGFSYESLTDGVLVVYFHTAGYGTENSYGCINRRGEIVVPPRFARIDSFKNGTAKAKILLNKDEDKLTWQYSGEFTASYKYYEVGVIDQKGNWLAPPRKKLEYSSRFYEPGGLVVSYANDKRSYAEREADRIRAEQKWNAAHAEKMRQLDALVAARLDAAKAQGMLIEKLN